MSTRRRALLVLAAAGALAAATDATAGSRPPTGGAGHVFAARQAQTADEVSTNWSGYVVSQDGITYTSVTATWRQPRATCGPGDAGAASAFWVGLGGFSTSSQTLEQIGTAADCSPTAGKPTYYAWYELVPKPSVTIKKLKVVPGDLITTSVNILGGTTVELQIKNRTRKTSFTTKLPLANPDVTSAEWIAEAPSSCNQYRCRPLPLTNFGSIRFGRIAALGNGAGGTLTQNPGWTTTSIQLVPGGSRGFFPGPDRFAGRSSSTAGATPGTALTDGRSFTVQWTADATSG